MICRGVMVVLIGKFCICYVMEVILSIVCDMSWDMVVLGNVFVISWRRGGTKYLL